ncbi:hypothetical protein F66182_6354 [Fusarium sp. NRRL 66182]|nr:hypothetical protein F66182_6354 [Fusarium sp. NRRL 66182]
MGLTTGIPTITTPDTVTRLALAFRTGVEQRERERVRAAALLHELGSAIKSHALHPPQITPRVTLMHPFEGVYLLFGDNVTGDAFSESIGCYMACGPELTKSSKASGRKGGSSAHQPASPGFLFIVNKLKISEPDRDIYLHHIPPSSPEKYVGEIPSKVMRYRNNEVTEVTDYYWYREPSMTPQGQLLRLDQDGNYLRDQNGQYFPAPEYKTFGVAACNPLLPIMVVDKDPLVFPPKSWDLLRIFHPKKALTGLSQVATIDSSMGSGGGPVLYVAGRSPSWMPGLVPKTYKSLPGNQRASRGLGGELPIILGLMALSAEHDESNSSTNDMFLGHNPVWRDGVWTGRDAPKGRKYSSSRQLIAS